MSHIYIYSPSSAVRNLEAFRRGIRRLKAMGHEVEVDADALRSAMRFAGDDQTRLAAIGRAAASGADVALISRGGYGLTRILPHLPYAAMAKAARAGMRFVGFSDFTALQLALLAREGVTTWAGPSVCDDFGAEVEADGSPDCVMQACFDDMLSGQGEGTGWRLSSMPDTTRTAADPNLKCAALPPRLKLGPGTLWGGNLCVLTSLMGTPYFPNVEGGILFLEDVAEHPYRIERMLSQLLHAGVLDRQRAIVLGQFTNYQPFAHDKGFKLSTVVQWLRCQTRTPVLTNLPMGHVPTKVLLPVGLPVTLTLDGKDAFLLWAHGH